MVRPRDKQARLDGILSIISDHDEIQYTAIKERIVLSDNVLSRYLKELIITDAVTSRQSGKNKFYKLSEKTLQNIRYKKLKTISNYQGDFELKIYEMDWESPDEIFEEVEKTLSALFFKFIFTGLDKGENWFDNFGLEDFARSVTHQIVLWMMHYDMPHDIKHTLDYDEMSEVFETFENTQLTDTQIDKLEELSDDIQNRYPDKVGHFGELWISDETQNLSDMLDKRKDTN